MNGSLTIHGECWTTCPPIPDSITILDISYTNISELPPLPPTLEELHLNHSRIYALPPLPRLLRVLDISYTPITEMPPLPSSLRELYMVETRLRQLPPPPSLHALIVSGEYFPRGIHFFRHQIPPLQQYFEYLADEEREDNEPPDITPHLTEIESGDCPICQDAGADVRFNTCSHTYHRTCISQWWRINRTCPMCRRHY